MQLPCEPDHNGECLVCDCWLSDCPLLKRPGETDEEHQARVRTEAFPSGRRGVPGATPGCLTDE